MIKWQNKYRGSVHEGCTINPRLTKKILVIFHNLWGYGNHLIMQEIGKSNVKMNVIQKRIRKIHGFYS